ncbi:hypothetical protein CMV30_07975 [Nibricoccus aquaticus]|uniref:Uncharacterized protein n=1 Tax=Nibricoccus aquaticus TaxID=2576891 RepID=A0A290Q9L9_9BACT|nr:hypothetical protein [Nibricoccus aquaticus]ATC63890.1 hypothetical protein CMV30_07975 [Nibricoccus aquaticus]
MEKIITFFRTYPVFLGFAFFGVIATGLFILFAVLMTRAGLSLRPLVFLGVFFAIIGVPQLFFHIQQARGVMPSLDWTPASNQPRPLENSAALANRDGKFLHPEKIFGPGFDPQLLSDIRPLFTGLDPEATQMAVFPSAETAVAARFSSEANAQQALANYGAMMGIARPQPAADGSYTAPRASDRVRLLIAGKTLFVWSAATDSALDRRQQASAAAFHSTTATTARDPRVSVWRKRFAIATPLLVLAAAFWFFKGSTWAATIAPVAENSLPASASELRARLLAIENLKQPITVTAGATPDEVIVTWRADAAWLTHAQASGLKRTHKLVLHLDESSRTLRVREYMSALDWSAAPDRAAVQWHMKTGIVFFEQRHERVFGLQLDPATGRFKPELSYAYTFNLQELKAPLIAATTHAGWTWKPILWKGPTWLRWATE